MTAPLHQTACPVRAARCFNNGTPFGQVATFVEGRGQWFRWRYSDHSPICEAPAACSAQKPVGTLALAFNSVSAPGGTPPTCWYCALRWLPPRSLRSASCFDPLPGPRRDGVPAFSGAALHRMQDVSRCWQHATENRRRLRPSKRPAQLHGNMPLQRRSLHPAGSA
jgi:hypothetical protein